MTSLRRKDQPWSRVEPTTQDAIVPTIAVDAMGGDYGPAVIVPGALAASTACNVELILVGDEAKIQAELAKYKGELGKISIVHTSQVVEMGEKPSEVLRRKKDSSIQVAFELVREGRAQGVVSAGHSGATVACGMFILGRINGVERPALASIIFTEKQPITLIDVGANVDCKPYHLFQFGLMADVLARDVLGIPNPSVGLLSIGEEEGKGNLQVKEAFELFKMTNSLNFVGNIEGRDIFTGNVNVIVCDGFVGNIALKLSEGLAMSIARMIKNELKRDLISKIGGLLIKDAMRRLKRVVDYSEYGGAPLLGLKEIVVVCHGSSSAGAITSAIDMAATFIRKKANEHLIAELSANEELSRFGKAAMKL
ncbi:phosphate acyltransferase PlsX [Megalodesulfovibrio paquesii]